MAIQRIRRLIEVLSGESLPPPQPPQTNAPPSVDVEFHADEGSLAPPPPTLTQAEAPEPGAEVVRPSAPTLAPPKPHEHTNEVSVEFLEGINGDDIEMDVEVDLACALYGGEVRLLLRNIEICPECHGSAPEGECPTCEGHDLTPTTRPLRVIIPPRVADGRRLRVEGYGEPGVAGGSDGDLVIRVKVTPDPRFAVHGRDLVTPLAVPVPEAILGGAVPLVMPNGSVLFVHVPPGCQSGYRLRLKRLGLERDGECGDLLVDVQLVLPRRIDAGLQRIAEAMREYYFAMADDERTTLPELRPPVPTVMPRRPPSTAPPALSSGHPTTPPPGAFGAPRPPNLALRAPTRPPGLPPGLPPGGRR